MRVLHVVTALRGGGAEGFVSLLATELARSGTTCGVVSVYPTEIPASLARGVEIIHIERRGRYDAGSFTRMCAAMRAWHPDVVHGHMSGGTFLGRLAAIAVGVPAVIRTEHAPCALRLPFRAANLANRALNVATDAVVTFSEAQARVLARREGIDPRKLVVIPNGIEHRPPPNSAERERARVRFGLAREDTAFLVLGNLHFPKNQRLALDAFALLAPEQRTTTRLMLAGDGRDRAELVARAHALGIAARVDFLGYRSDVDALLAVADALVMPSLTEGLPLAMLEAMSAGVPVVSTPWIGAEDLLKGGALGTIASDFSPQALASALEAVACDREGAARIAERAQARVRATYDIATSARRHLELYASILARSAPWAS